MCVHVGERGQNARCSFHQCHLRGPEGTPLRACRGLELRGGGRGADSLRGTAASVWRRRKPDGLICMEREKGRGGGVTSKPRGLPASRGQEEGQEPTSEIEEKEPRNE